MRSSVQWRNVAIVIAALAAVTPSVHAGVTTYTSSADFLTAISSDTTSMENFATLSPGTTIAAGDTVDGLTYSAFTPGPAGTLLGGFITTQYNSVSPNSLGGDQSNGAQFFFGGDSVTVTFAAPVNAFGLLFNVNPNSGDYGFSTSLGTATTGSTTYDSSTFVFAGLVSTDSTFTSATFYSTDTSLGSYNVPEIITATSAVPEPAGLLLAGTGIASLLLWKRRRQAYRDDELDR